MKKFGITVHTLVRNEERWIWYALNSVLNYADKIVVFDTGSTDKTVEIIKTIKSPKIVFEQKGIVTKKNYTVLRQEMLEKTTTSWFIVVDGDEVWPRVAIQKLVAKIKSVPREIEAIVVPQWVCQGDVFHYSREVEELHEDRTGRMGFWLPRAFRFTPGLHAKGEYGVESFVDKHGINVSHWDLKRLVYIEHKFFHMTFLLRSDSIQKDRLVMMRAMKRRYDLGLAFPKDFKYPEVFYQTHPQSVPSPWLKYSWFTSFSGVYYKTLNFVNRRGI